MTSRQRFPRLWKAHHFGTDPEFAEERWALADQALADFLGKPVEAISFGDRFAASLGYTVEDPVFQAAISDAMYEVTGETLDGGEYDWLYDGSL